MPSKNKTTSTQTSTLNPWSQQQYQQLSGQIQGLVNQPFHAYTGPISAGMDPLQDAARANAQNNIGAGQAAVNTGIDAARGMLGFAAQPVSAPTAHGPQLGPASAYGAQGYQASTAQAAQAGAPTLASSQGYDAAQMASVSSGPAAMARFRSYQAQTQGQTKLGAATDAEAARSIAVRSAMSAGA